jgi:hypothetical protein
MQIKTLATLDAVKLLQRQLQKSADVILKEVKKNRLIKKESKKGGRVANDVNVAEGGGGGVGGSLISFD